MSGRARERVVATCGLLRGCTYECHGGSSTVVSPSREAPPVSPPVAGGASLSHIALVGLTLLGLKQFQAVRGYPQLGNVCRVSVHSVACNLAVSAENLTASIAQNDPQPPGRGRLRAATDCALQMVYRQQGKRDAHSTRTFVLPQ